MSKHLLDLISQLQPPVGYEPIEVLLCKRCRDAFVIEPGRPPAHDPKTCKPWPADSDMTHDDVAIEIMLRMGTTVSQ